MTESRITFRTNTNQGSLDLAVALDGMIHWHGTITQTPAEICVIVDDAVESDHELTLTLSGKTLLDTQIDSQGNIIQDKVLNVHGMAIDDINIETLMMTHSRYTHDFNGTQAVTQTRFFGTMGCNGTVSLAFSTPVYLWLLQHM